MEFQQSRTYQNIVNTYEDQLRSNAKYGLFSKKARQENLIGISFLFDTESRHEEFIAERLRRVIFNGDTNTLQNLTEASEEVVTESALYREYAQIAQEEGFEDLSSLFSGIANIKLNQNTHLNYYIDAFQNNELFCKSEERLWICLGCGNIMSGECAPETCPICGYPQGYYELFTTF